jgi:hypothetical protein
VVIWNRELVEVNARTDGDGPLRRETARPGVNESLFGHCEATFTLDKDGKWKLKTLKSTIRRRGRTSRCRFPACEPGVSYRFAFRLTSRASIAFRSIGLTKW